MARPLGKKRRLVPRLDLSLFPGQRQGESEDEGLDLSFPAPAETPTQALIQAVGHEQSVARLCTHVFVDACRRSRAQVLPDKLGADE